MAFEPKQKEIRQALGLDHSDKVPQLSQARKHENKKQYQFTIKPSNREKLRRISAERGYRSDSAFLDELIEKL